MGLQFGRGRDRGGLTSEVFFVPCIVVEGKGGGANLQLPVPFNLVLIPFLQVGFLLLAFFGAQTMIQCCGIFILFLLGFSPSLCLLLLTGCIYSSLKNLVGVKTLIILIWLKKQVCLSKCKQTIDHSPCEVVVVCIVVVSAFNL